MHIRSLTTARTLAGSSRVLGNSEAGARQSGSSRPAHRKPEAGAADAAAPALNKTILLVDDEFGIVVTLKELLESEGYQVVCASNGKDALSRMATQLPDLAVLDVMMPVMNGIDVLRAMRANVEQKNIPVLLMSAVPRTIVTKDAEALDGSGWSFIRKPFEFLDLLDSIRLLIGPAAREVN